MKPLRGKHLKFRNNYDYYHIEWMTERKKETPLCRKTADKSLLNFPLSTSHTYIHHSLAFFCEAICSIFLWLLFSVFLLTSKQLRITNCLFVIVVLGFRYVFQEVQVRGLGSPGSSALSATIAAQPVGFDNGRQVIAQVAEYRRAQHKKLQKAPLRG